MGLDMFLRRKNKNYGMKTANWEEVMYWCKANQIRKWFVDNLDDEVQNLRHIRVTKENLISLVEVCKKVLEQPDLAPSLLPTSSGFFFGSSEYDEWYFEDLKMTVEEIEKVISETDWKTQDIYYLEWY